MFGAKDNWSIGVKRSANSHPQKSVCVCVELASFTDLNTAQKINVVLYRLRSSTNDGKKTRRTYTII